MHHQTHLSLHDRIVGPGRRGGKRGRVRGLGDAEVHRGDDRHGDAADHVQRRIDHTVRPVGRNPLVRHEHVLEDDVVAGGAADPERVPIVEDGHALTGEGHRHVEHPAALLGIVEPEHRRHHGAVRRLAGEHLARRHPVATVDPRRLAPRPGEVGPARRHEHDPVVGNAAQGGLGAGHGAPVAPGREAHDVLVHRGRQGGRPAMVRELALHHRHLPVGGPQATELGRHRQRHQSRLAEQPQALLDERALRVVPGGVASDLGADRGGAIDQVVIRIELHCGHWITVRRDGGPP